MAYFFFYHDVLGERSRDQSREMTKLVGVVGAYF